MHTFLRLALYFYALIQSLAATQNKNVSSILSSQSKTENKSTDTKSVKVNIYVKDGHGSVVRTWKMELTEMLSLSAGL